MIQWAGTEIGLATTDTMESMLPLTEKLNDEKTSYLKPPDRRPNKTH